MAGVQWTLAALEAQFPRIPWREPVLTSIPGFGPRYCCRICIAQRGLKGTELVDVGFESHAGAREHLKGHGVS